MKQKKKMDMGVIERLVERLEVLVLKVRLINGETEVIVGRFDEYGIIPNEYPERYHKYAIRHSDDDDSVPITLEKGKIWVNHFGDFLSRTELDRDIESHDGYLDILDWSFEHER